MNVLGVAGQGRDAAAAVARDGRLTAAVLDAVVARSRVTAPDGLPGWPATAIDACLTAAGIRADEIHQIVLVGDDNESDSERRVGFDAPVSRVDPLAADAIHAMTSTGTVEGAVICSGSPRAIVAFEGPPASMTRVGPLADADALEAAAGRLAAVLGVSGTDPLGSLDRLSSGAAAAHEPDVAAALDWPDRTPGETWIPYLDRLTAEYGGRLVDAGSAHVPVQRARASIAASFLTTTAGRLAAAIRNLAGARGWPHVALGGGWLAHARVVEELRTALGPLARFAAAPDASGRALGAALSAGVPASDWPGLALGPSFTEGDIKHTLDNCRLDYVYEPDWTRLLTRVSKMLEQGKVIAWFQGAASFGGRSFGTRGILCDPSGRYARHNVNEYLRQVPLDTPLPIVVAPDAMAGLTEPVAAFEARAMAVSQAWEAKIAGALDARRHVEVHGVSAAQSPELCALLNLHYARTGTPALIEVPLAGPGEPLACTPRDAVRIAYSSAADALVIARLLLMKDHWLLRTETT